MKSDLPATDDSTVLESLHQEIERSLSTLQDKEANVIRMYFGLAPFSPS
jgi:RNA polymerase primary sigma factor